METNIYFCFIDYTKAFDCVDKKILWTILKERNARLPYLPPEKPVCKTRSNSYNWTWNNGLVQNWERNISGLYAVILFI